MANPQPDKHTRISNELLGALVKARLNGVEWRIVMTVIRKTYGFNKKKDRISYSQFQEYTDSPRSAVHKAIKSLVAKRVLVANRLPLGSEYGLNKDYSQWVVAKCILVAKMDLGSSQLGTQLDTNRGYTKDNTKYKQKTVKNKVFYICKECNESSDVKGIHSSQCSLNQ